MRNVLGVVNLHDCPHLGPLTTKRPTGATTFLGRYGLMDFTLSNFANSDVDKVVVLAESNYRSVRNHLRDGQIWVNNTKLGFQRILTNENLLSASKFNTDIANLMANKNVFYENEPTYVIVAPVFFLMSYDYNELLEKHIESGADVTVLCKHIDNSNKEFVNCDVVSLDDKGFVTDFTSNSGRKKEVDISLESFIINTDVLLDICNKQKDVSLLYSLRQMISYLTRNGELRVATQFFDGFVVPILSFEHYVRHSFNLLDSEKRAKLFLEDWPIYTTTHNTPPAMYGERAIVSNSFIANGCVIKGKVKNSILSRDVVIEEGAVVENCIVFTHTEIGQNVKLRHVVTDKFSIVNEVKKINRDKDDIMYIGKGEKV